MTDRDRDRTLAAEYVVGLLDADEAAPAGLLLADPEAEVEQDPGSDFQLRADHSVAQGRVRRVLEVLRCAVEGPEVVPGEDVRPAHGHPPLHRQAVAVHPAVAPQPPVHPQVGRDPDIAPEVEEQPGELVGAAEGNRGPHQLRQIHRRHVGGAGMLEPGAKEPPVAGEIALVPGIEVDLHAGGEVVPVVDRGVGAPLVAVPEQGPGVGGPNRALLIPAAGHLQPQRAGRLGPEGPAVAAAVEIVAVVALQEERGPPDLAARQRLILDGSEPECEWKNDPRSKVPGTLPAELMPRITRDDYVTNSNDSYWLANPAAPLEGFSPIIGPERTERSLRTRAGLTLVREALEKDGKLSPAGIQQMLYSHRNYGAELLLDDVLEVCAGDTGSDIAQSCAALSKWDRTANVDSIGVPVWMEFWKAVSGTDGLYSVPFDPAEPVDTPRGIATDKPEVRTAVRSALAKAQAVLQDAGIPFDAPWGQVQFAKRNGTNIPIPGAPGSSGMFSYIISRLSKGEGYTPIITGNSYIQVISWDEAGELHSQGMLTYSQSPEPESPHYSDLTELYSRGEWIDFPFSEEEILADPNLRRLTLSGD